MPSVVLFSSCRLITCSSKRNLLNISLVAASQKHERSCSKFFRTRKPLWKPTSKEKLFRIPKHPFVPEDDLNEHLRLFNVYKTKINSIEHYFVDEFKQSDTLGQVTLDLAKKEEIAFNKLLELNDAENARVAQMREERSRRELEQKEEELLQKAIDMEEWRKNKQKEIEELVRIEKEKSKSYITTKKLDAAIEEALDNPVNYNFAIDLEGKIHWETVPHPEEDPKYESASVPVVEKSL